MSILRSASRDSLNTLHREYSALAGLEFCDINYLIYKPSLSEPVTVSTQELQTAMKSYQVNEPQAKAILSSMSTKGFSLIQGCVWGLVFVHRKLTYL